MYCEVQLKYLKNNLLAIANCVTLEIVVSTKAATY